MNEVDLKKILSDARTIAVVGMSDRPHRESHRIGMMLDDVGYRVMPVNPTIDASSA